MKDHNDKQQQAQKDLVAAQAALQAAQIGIKDKLHELKAQGDDKLNQLYAAVAKQKALIKKLISADRLDILNKYQQAVSQARAACSASSRQAAQDMRAKRQTAAVQGLYRDTMANMIERATIGATAYDKKSAKGLYVDCLKQLETRQQMQNAENEREKALAELQSRVDDAQADLNNVLGQIQNLISNLNTEQQLAMEHAQADLQNASKQMESAQNAIMANNQQFQQEQQQLTAAVKKDESLMNNLQAEYNQNKTMLAQIGVTPNETLADDKKSALLRDIETVQNGISYDNILDETCKTQNKDGSITLPMTPRTPANQKQQR